MLSILVSTLLPLLALYLAGGSPVNPPTQPECLSASDSLGQSYRGTKSQTVNGRTCQRWDAKSPHSPKYRPPNPSSHSNYCRNPDGDPGGLWCYTTDINTRWERCQVPTCQDECFVCNGESYRGKVSTTKSGKTCQRWDSSRPHQHSNHPSKRPGKNLEENFCRNPDGEPMPWCYTNDPRTRWEYCDIKRCTKPNGDILIPEVQYTTDCTKGRGENYRGTVTRTRSGRICAPWNNQTPQGHEATPQKYPCSGLDQNYCRNPTPHKETGPWCYTTDPEKEWEYCDIPQCLGQTASNFKTTDIPATIASATTRSSPPTTPHVTTTVRQTTPSNPTSSAEGVCGVQVIQPSLETQGFNIYDGEVVLKERTKRNSPPRRGRILGGEIAVHGSWPWIASLRKPGDFPYCGGVLISPSWVMSVAHCLDDGFDPGDLSVKMGHHRGKEEQTQIRSARRIVLHEGYNLDARRNDIGLMELERPFDITDYVRPVCLPELRYIVPAGSYCVVAGWGFSYIPELDVRPRLLKQAVIPVPGIAECRTKYLGWNMYHGGQMCAGDEGSGYDVCKGDSGGPLVCLNGNRWTVQGLTSWGRSCKSMQGNYGAYTRVSFYVDWIEQKMAE